MSPSRRHLLLVALLLFGVAFGLRAWRGSVGLYGGQNWDEQYALENVRSLLETGSFKPAKSYYPSPVFNAPATALVAAAEAWHERSGEARWDAYDKGRFLAMSYLLCRWLSALYGALGVLLLWRIGSRLAGEGVGVVAAVLLAFLPWHLFSSSIFKPDALLTMSVLLTFWAGLHAIARRSLVWAAVAGVGIALAASAKLTGVVVAGPLALGLVAAAPRERRRWAQLALAAVVSGLAFIALNPYWAGYLHFVESLKEDYAKRALLKGWNRLDAARLSLALFFDGYVHGPVLGFAAVGGAIGSAVSALRSQDPVTRACWAMLLAFPPLWIGILVTQTAYFKPNNLLPVMAISCLLVAWALERAWRWAGGHLVGGTARRILATAVLVGILLLGVRPGYLYVYRQVTQSTIDAAERFLARRLHDGGRVVYAESLPRLRPAWHRARRFGKAVVEVERLDAVDPRTLDWADGEIFHLDRLAGKDAEFFEARMARVREKDLLILRPRWFTLRGTPLVVLRHPRRPVAGGGFALAPCPGEPRCFSASLPGRDSGSGGALLTLQLSVARRPYRAPATPPVLTVAGHEVAVLESRTTFESLDFVTLPTTTPETTVPVEIRLPAGDYLAEETAAPAASWATWRRPKHRRKPAPSDEGVAGQPR